MTHLTRRRRIFRSERAFMNILVAFDAKSVGGVFKLINLLLSLFTWNRMTLLARGRGMRSG